jgi:uncharacterized protein (TIGR03382 family)
MSPAYAGLAFAESTRMLRLALVLVALSVPSIARADCAQACDSVCYAGPSALFRAEVIEAQDGFAQRVLLTERLGGSQAVLAEVGDERDDVYAESVLAIGDELVVAITESDSVNTAWRVDADVVQCSNQQRTVELDQYVAMATSADCEQVAEDLELVNRCDDTVGCSSGGGSSLAMLAVIGLVVLRRRRAA